MNIENLNKIADWLDAGAPHVYFDLEVGIVNASDAQQLQTELDYDGLDEYLADHNLTPQPDCGTICCIAGAAHLMSIAPEGQLFPSLEDQAKEQNSWRVTRASALDYLGLPHNNYQKGHDLFDNELAPDNCTPQEAAAAVRRVIAGQEPWT